MYNILVVDDSEGFGASMKAFLTKAGPFTVHTCSNPAEAVPKAKSLMPHLDLVLLDIVMPGLHGDEVASKMREEPDLKDLAVVFLTGSAKEIVTHRELPSGFGKIGGEDFILKGAKPHEIARWIEKAIQENRAKKTVSSRATGTS